jgi:adenine-specific DNA-methyltransferase
MITYIGNKRKLVPWIMEIIEGLFDRPMRVLDAFAGSGVVSRALMPFCSELYSNDMELYSYTLLRCFLETPNIETRAELDRHFEELDRICLREGGDEGDKGNEGGGFITRLYSPKNTKSPQPGERCFYTRENARIIDAALDYIFSVDERLRHYLLGPLLIKASINVNTAGVFRGFYKKDGVGHFGGAGENALERILAPIRLSRPIWSQSSCKSVCYKEDAISLIETFSDGELDLIYLDPPYNEHPYGSNYFMLNIIAEGREPLEYSKVSGIPKNWNKSAFNGRGSAVDAMRRLLAVCIKKAKYVLISYNNEGLVEDWCGLFSELGCTWRKYEKEYDTYHGSRNLAGRNKKVFEQMYLISATDI